MFFHLLCGISDFSKTSSAGKGLLSQPLGSFLLVNQENDSQHNADHKRDRQRRRQKAETLLVFMIQSHLFLRLLYALCDAGGKTGKPLKLRRNDDFGRLAVGHLLHGLKRFELDDLIVRIGVVQKL